jgi:hypothetical protein
MGSSDNAGRRRGRAVVRGHDVGVANVVIISPFDPFVDTHTGRGLRSGLPFIPLTLILSRLETSGSALTLLPLILLSSSSPSQHRIRLEFPPSPALAFVLFPWVRVLYLRSWETVKRWDESMLMRSDKTAKKSRDAAAGNHGRTVHPRRRRRDGLRLVVGALTFPGMRLLLLYMICPSNRVSTLLTCGLTLGFIYPTKGLLADPLSPQLDCRDSANPCKRHI